MKLTDFGNMVQLTFFPGIFPVNCYIVKEENELTLVDAAIASAAPSILRAAESIGLPVTRILITHGHVDHVGALDKLRAIWPDVEVMISKRDSRLLAGDTGLLDGEPNMKIKGGIPKCQTKPTRLLEAGDRIGSLEVIACPGHTPGQIAFLDVRDNTLIAGDAFQTHRGTAVSGTVVPLFPFPAMATWNKVAALESARHLLSLNPSRLAVGHGRVLTQPQAAMKRAITVALRKVGV